MSNTEQKTTTAVAVLNAGASPLAIVPKSFEEVYRLGRLLAASKLVPKDYQGHEEDCTVAIMQGLEVGLPPLAAVQSICVINGRPTLWGDGALGVVRASGLLEEFDEQGDDNGASCTVKRKGEKPLTRTFSMTDARKAGLAGKTGPWQTYPRRMLQMRARAWALRDGFADVLKGLRVAEEEADAERMRDITPPADIDVPDLDVPPAPVADCKSMTVIEAEPLQPADVELPMFDYADTAALDNAEALLAELEKKLEQAVNLKEVKAIEAEYGPTLMDLGDDARDQGVELIEGAKAIHRHERKRKTA